MSVAPRICLVTPGNVASNPRLVKEAQALRDAGYRLRIVAADIIPSLSPYDAEIFAALDCGFERVSARTPRHRRFVRAGVQRAARLAMRLPRRAGSGLELAGWAHHPLTRALGKAAARQPADLYLAHNLAALPAAARAAARHQAKFGFDAEDFHSGELENHPENAVELATRRVIERTLLPRCTHLTAASPGIAGEYHRLYSVRPETILNVFPLREAPREPSAGNIARGEEPSLYWFSQTVGRERGLEAIVRAMGRMTVPAWLRLRGHPSPGYLEALRDLARQSGGEDLARRVEVLPVAPPHEMARLAAGHDLGLALEQPHPPNRALCLTNKIFVYLLAGLPICLSRTPAQQALAVELGESAFLVDLDDPAAVARALDKHLADPACTRRARAAAWTLAQTRFNWDLECRRFLDSIRRSLYPLSW